MVDANSPLIDVNFSKFITDTGLFDIIGAKKGMDSPRTYNRGSKTIDFLLGTEEIVRSIRQCGMLRFQDGINSDHRGLWIDICILQLFRGDIHDIHRPPARKVITKQRKRCHKYRSKFTDKASETKIQEALKAFQPNDPANLTNEEEDELNRLDDMITDSILQSEKSLPSIPTYWWFERLHVRHRILKYWKLRLSATRTTSNIEETLTKMEIELADEDIFQGDSGRTIHGQIRKAYKLRRATRNDSFNLRQAFLEKLAEEEAAVNENSTKEKILRSMRKTKAQRRMYKIFTNT